MGVGRSATRADFDTACDGASVMSGEARSSTLRVSAGAVSNPSAGTAADGVPAWRRVSGDATHSARAEWFTAPAGSCGIAVSACPAWDLVIAGRGFRRMRVGGQGQGSLAGREDFAAHNNHARINRKRAFRRRHLRCGHVQSRCSGRRKECLRRRVWPRRCWLRSRYRTPGRRPSGNLWRRETRGRSKCGERETAACRP